MVRALPELQRAPYASKAQVNFARIALFRSVDPETRRLRNDHDAEQLCPGAESGMTTSPESDWGMMLDIITPGLWFLIGFCVCSLVIVVIQEFAFLRTRRKAEKTRLPGMSMYAPADRH